MADICQDFEVAPSLVHKWKWKKEFLESGADLFAEKRGPKAKANEQTKKIQQLHEKVGELTLERDFLKKVGANIEDGAISDA